MPTLTQIIGSLYDGEGNVVTQGKITMRLQQDIVSVDGTKVAPFVIEEDLSLVGGVFDKSVYATVGASPAGVAYFVEFDPDPTNTDLPPNQKDGYWSNYWAVPNTSLISLGTFVSAHRGEPYNNYMPLSGGGGGGTIGGTGTTNYVPLFSGATTLTNSILSQAASAISCAGPFSITGGNALGLGSSGAANTFLVSAAANVLAQLNAANAQRFDIYNTFSSSTIYERGYLWWNSNIFRIGTTKGSGGGTNRSIYITPGDLDAVIVSPAGNVTIAGSVTAGSGAVGIINSAGKIPALTSTYFASVSFDAANLTGTVPAATLTGRSLADLGTRSAADLSSGNLAYARMPTGPGTWSATPTISSTTSFGADVMPLLSYTSDIGSSIKKFRLLHAAELVVETLVAQSTMATIGGRVLVAPTNLLTADLTNVATSIQVKYNNFTNGDRVYMEGGGNIEWMAITSSATGSAGAYIYTVTRNLDGSGANAWSAGDAILDTGTTGNGFIDLFSTTGVLSGDGPTIIGNVRTGTTYNQVSPRWAIGNIKNIYGYSSTNVYGAAFGDPSTINVTIDATNGFRIRSGTTNKMVASTAGDLLLTGFFEMGTAGAFYTTGVGGFTTGTGWWLDYNAGTPRFRVGNPAGNQLKWDGSNLTFVAANTTLDASGNLTVNGGSIAAFTLSSNTISASNFSLTSGATNVANLQVGTGSNIAGLNSANAASDIAIWAGSTFANRATAPFRIRADGAATMSSVTISAGGVSLDSTGLFISPVSASGGGAYANANAVRWTTSTTNRTAIWRSDDTAATSYKIFNLEHINDYTNVTYMRTNLLTQLTGPSSSVGESKLTHYVDYSQADMLLVSSGLVSGSAKKAYLWLLGKDNGASNLSRIQMGVGGTAPTGNLNAGTVGVGFDIDTSGITVAGSFGAFTMTGTLTVASSAILLTGSNADIEMGSVSASNTPVIDFHSSGNNIDYDTRILASGGNGTSGNGALTVTAGGGFIVQNASGQARSKVYAEQSIANNGTATLGTINGFVFFSVNTNPALYAVQAQTNATTLVAGAPGTFTTVSGNAGTINVYSVANVITVENKTGSTFTFYYTFIE